MLDDIRLDFRVTEQSRAEMQTAWSKLHRRDWAFGLALFATPVFLQIRETILIDWIRAPLYSFATLGLIRLESLQETGVGDVPIFGTDYRLRFTLSGEDVQVIETLSKRQAKARDAQLLIAWQQFANRVRDFIVEEFPDVLKREDEIGGWFRGEK